MPQAASVMLAGWFCLMAAAAAQSANNTSVAAAVPPAANATAAAAALAAAAARRQQAPPSAGAVTNASSLPQAALTESRPAAAANATPAAARPPPAAAAAAAPQQAKSNHLTHNGQQLFLTGVNLGNVQFLPFQSNPYGYTVAEMQGLLEGAFADLAAAGANSVRFWLHIDGSRSPSWTTTQGGVSLVSGLPDGLVDDLKWLLRTAYDKYGILVCVSLWSHDILAVRRWNSVSNRARAVHMMSDDDATSAYINNALLPMLEALGEPMRPGGPTYLDAVVSWDVLNEPEGVARHWRLYKNYMYSMRYGNYSWWNPNTYQLLRRKASQANLTGEGGAYVGWYFYQEDGTFNNFMYHDVFDNYPSEWDFMKAAIVDKQELTTVEVPHSKVLRFINRLAGAIHRAVPGAKVTVGAHSMPYATDIPMPNLWYDNAPMNYYSDDLLVAAGGDPDGTLDFYAVHGYAIWNEGPRDRLINMFLNPKSHWKVDKPILVGEHWEQVMPYPSTVTVDNYLHLYDTGYAGGWGWAWFNVTESYNYTTGTVLGRGIGQHKCRGSLRRLLAGLPQRLKYSVKRPQAAAAGATSPAAVVG